jgi:hypothetical protein
VNNPVTKPGEKTVLAAREPNKAHRSNATSAAEQAAGSHHRGAQPPSRAQDRSAVTEAAQLTTAQQIPDQSGKPLDRRSPFFIGLSGAAGVASWSASSK